MLHTVMMSIRWFAYFCAKVDFWKYSKVSKMRSTLPLSTVLRDTLPKIFGAKEEKNVSDWQRYVEESSAHCTTCVKHPPFNAHVCVHAPHIIIARKKNSLKRWWRFFFSSGYKCVSNDPYTTRG